jgi:hypothetical protein
MKSLIDIQKQTYYVAECVSDANDSDGVKAEPKDDSAGQRNQSIEDSARKNSGTK